jgi:RNA polymerase sigma factor (sigma-70 family)
MTLVLAHDHLFPSRLVDAENAANLPEFSVPGLTVGMAQGNDEAWQQFHGRYYIFLLRCAASRTSCLADATEVVQQAYLRIARHIKPFKEETPFLRWLVCVVRCAALDHRRGIVRRGLLLEKFGHWQQAQTVPANIASDAQGPASVLADALSKLPSADAELLRLKYYEGWTVESLAIEGNTTAKAIENRLARLRQRLREIIRNSQ